MFSSPYPLHTTLTSFLPPIHSTPLSHVFFLLFTPLSHLFFPSSPLGPLCVGELSKHCGFSVSLGIGMILCALNAVWITFYLKEPTVQGPYSPFPGLLFPSFIHLSICLCVYMSDYLNFYFHPTICRNCIFDQHIVCLLLYFLSTFTITVTVTVTITITVTVTVTVTGVSVFFFFHYQYPNLKS